MKVIIWGAGRGCEYALAVCKELSWDIVAIVDSNLQKKGLKVSNWEIQDITMLNNIDDQTYIVIANAYPEVLELAKQYTNLIIEWKTLCTLYKGAAQYPNYETRELEEENLKHCRLVKDREAMLVELSTHYKETFNFAEVGVAYGDFSKNILQICKPGKLFLIDAWEGERYGYGLALIEDSFRSEINDGRIEIRRGYSNQVLKQFDNKSIDIVYIDTNHTYETTWEELLICNEKVKDNGFICGHDYTKFNPISRMDYGVYDAVNRFCVEYGYEIYYLTMEKEGLHSYALRKISKE